MVTPEASVILPLYNGEATVQAAVDSILHQTFANFELLILDDGSTDSSASVVSAIADPRIKLISRNNKGLGATLNELIDHASSEYIFRMDADDFAAPRRLELQLQHLRDHPSTVLLGGQIEFTDGENFASARRFPLDHDSIVSELLEARFPLCHPAVAFRRSAAMRVGCYRVKGAGEDLDFFLRLSEVGKVENIDDMVLSYRVTLSSLSMKRRSELQRGYAFALDSRRCRMDRRPEPEISAFFQEYDTKKSRLRELLQAAEWSSEDYYRKFLCRRMKGSYFSAYLSLVAASILRPRRALKRIF